MGWKNKENQKKYAYERYHNDKEFKERKLKHTKKWIASHRKKHHDIILEFKKECLICGEKDKDCLLCHHRNPKEKLFTIGSVIGRIGTKQLILELEKCDVLCANCHIKFHRQEKNKQKIISLCKDRINGIEPKLKKIKFKKLKKVSKCPTKEILERLMNEKPMTHIGKEFGVTSNSVKKWAKKYNLMLKPQGYWLKLENKEKNIQDYII